MKGILDFFSGKFTNVFSAVTRKKHYTPTFDIQNFEKLIAVSELFQSGQVYLISLQFIHDELGSRWINHRDEIVSLLSTRIKNNIGEDDIFCSRSEIDHLVVFTDHSKPDAKQICGDILKQITIKYLGKSYDHNIILRLAIGRRNGKLLFKDVAYSSKTENELIEEQQRIASEVTPKLEAFASPIKAKKKRPYELIYKPIWDKKNNVVSTFMVSIRKTGKQDINDQVTGPIGHNALKNPFCLASMIELDQFMLDEIIEMMQDFFKNNFRAMFSIPLNYKTLFNLTRLHNFLIRCQSIPIPLRKYITFSLAGFPEGFPEARMHEIITSLLTFCRDVTIVCDKIPTDVGYFKACGIKGICLNITERERTSNAYLGKIQKLAIECTRENINLSLDGIDNFEELMVMKETELNFISGNTIGRYDDAPHHIKPLNWDDLVKH
ncbi:MAG: hypothetical protein KDF58_02325 [Alphaproteobacteria bacterium]|nr:hypothetical protein [Alphaproteobacteria bacterium]